MGGCGRATPKRFPAPGSCRSSDFLPQTSRRIHRQSGHVRTFAETTDEVTSVAFDLDRVRLVSPAARVCRPQGSMIRALEPSGIAASAEFSSRVDNSAGSASPGPRVDLEHIDLTIKQLRVIVFGSGAQLRVKSDK